MGIILRNEDGSYRNILDVFLDISKIWSKIKGGIKMKLRDFYENTKDTLSAIIKIYNKDYIEIHEGNITTLEVLEDVILDTEINDMYIGYDYTLAIVLDSFDKDYTLKEMEDMLSKMGVRVKNADGSYRETFDVLADMGEAMTKIKEELGNENNYGRIL